MSLTFFYYTSPCRTVNKRKYRQVTKDTQSSCSWQTRRNRALSSVSTLLLSFLLCISKPSNAQSSSPAFACDITRDPSLAGFEFCNTAEDRVSDLVGRLTLDKKIGFLVSQASGRGGPSSGKGVAHATY
ncbi:hypothetical protein Bca52824_021532 [Brassica carinata]|uniref:Uncharacterized protein n=1 Tax=Brassica carinata TaxID=52824 RepID=A0A8X7VFD0_BRACI|nr:hypothetical protein Bca52824_021532 [Brassica carinata]